jgi:replicative DNA helicase Mcm
MSLGTISIAKASIVATLPAQTSILAGGNPKLGRFDPYMPIREQIDINDVLLSRFDLKFALRDMPNPEVDERMVDHVLRMRHFQPEESVPTIGQDLLRKYIAYARASCHPVLTEEAGKMIKEFYLEMRSKAGGESAVSITLRQYESLIRLAEASAKIRLSEKVEEEDAQRAINLMKISLRQFGLEPETGMIDIDRAEGLSVTAAQRSKIRTMLDLIDALVGEFGKTVPEEEIIRRAERDGIRDAEQILRKMLNEGVLFSPKVGFVEKVS